jgi:hypothetical protein
MDTEPQTPPAGGPAPNSRAPLLQVRSVTIQYKTPQTLMIAVYRGDFDIASCIAGGLSAQKSGLSATGMW